MGKERLPIVFENEALIVVNKPAGLLSIPDRYYGHLPSAKQMLRDKYGEIFVVHRLDKDTSGLILFAKDAETHKELSSQFEEHTVIKEYLAVVEGQVNDEDGSILEPISFNKQKQAVELKKTGKNSITHYEVLERFQDYSYLKLRIETGRMHQIRVHLKSIGHPLMVDSKYGHRDAFFLSEIKRKKYHLAKDTEERPLLHRHPLHCFKLGFTLNGKPIELNIMEQLPKDIKAILNQLRKHNPVRESF